MEKIKSNDVKDCFEDELDYSKIGKKVVLSLNEKFKEDFFIKKITNKFGMGYFDYITCVCSPMNNEKMCFTVIYDFIKDKIIEEDYYIRYMCFELEEYIVSEFKKEDIESIAKLSIFGKKKLDKKYSVEEFSNEYENNNFLATIIIKEKVAKEKIFHLYETIKDSYSNIFLKSIVYVISKENFYKLLEKTKNIPKLSETVIKEYGVEKTYIIKIQNNEVIEID